MNVFSLELDELEIEFTLRDIPLDEINKVQVLQDRVSAEEARNEPEPNKMHLNAAKRPDIEIASCRTKLQELQEDINTLAGLDAEQQIKSAKKIEARLMHVAGRLSRATTSRTYGREAQLVLESSQVLLTCVKLYLSDLDKLNESIEAAKAVNLNPPQISQELRSQVGDDQNYAMAGMMAQMRQIATQVAELSKQLSDQKRKTEDIITAATARVTFSEVTSSPVHTINIKSASQPSTSRPSSSKSMSSHQSANTAICSPPMLTSSKEDQNVPHSATSQIPGSQQTYLNPHCIIPPATPIVSQIPGLPQTYLNPHYMVSSQIPIVSQIPSIQPTYSQPHYNVSSATPIGSQMPGMINPNFMNLPSTSTASTQYINNDVQSNRYAADHRSLSRSGISFDGSPTGTPIKLFLFQIETLAVAMHLDNDKLLTQISFVLKGIAAHWYWTYRQQNPWVNWLELRQRMIERFQNRRPDSDIENEIESRKQLPTQTFLDFYQQMWGLTIQLSVPYPDQQLMKILRKNMRPGLRYQLTDRQFSNIGELISSCTSWENTWADLNIDPDSFVPSKRGFQSGRYATPQHGVNEVQDIMNQSCYNMAYSDPNYFGPQVAAIQRPTTAANKSPYLEESPTALNDPKYVICYNCEDIGHVFADCPVPPTRCFCYRCGLKDTITPNCTRCSENSQRGHWRTGNQSSPRYLQTTPQQTTARHTTPNNPK